MPVVDRILPDRGEPEDRFTVRIEGDRLSRVSEVSFGEGVSVSRLDIIDDGTITVKVDISVHASPGPRDVQVTDPESSEILSGGFEVLAT